MQYTLKKSLGQHFLKDENICQKIIATLEKEKLHQLVEIGPGAGALTKYLLAIPNIHFKAIELDDEKIAYLCKTYPNIKDKIIHVDFLKATLPFDNEFIVIGNFPYNISSQILFKILDWKENVTQVIGMFQKEVAQRVAAMPNSKNYGILSVLVQIFYKVEYLFDVPPSCFNPPPKVMSGVIKMERKDTTLPMQSQKHLFTLVKMAFNQRRKMLRNAVKSLFDEQELSNPLFTKRAEDLTIEDFAQLTFKMK